MKRYLILLALIPTLPPAIRAEEIQASKSLNLNQVLEIAEKQNPDILAARQSWKVSQAQIGPTKAWPNPTFTYVDEKFPSAMEGTPPQQVRHYRFEQMVPFPGKLTSEGRMKYHEVLISEDNYQSKRFDVLGEVRMRYYQLYLIDQKISLARQSVESLKSVLQTAQSRLASGQSSTSDVFMAQMELRKMENALYEEEQARTMAQVELNSLLNQPTDTSWGSAQAPHLVDLPVSLTDFQTLAKENDPQFWAAMHESNHAKAMLNRNRLEFVPDFNFMYELETSPGGEDGRQIGVGVSIPLWLTRPIGLYNSSKEHLLETEAVSDSLTNVVMKNVHLEFVETTTHLALSRNYERDILPTAQSNLKIARQQYASGRGDFLRVLEALRTWIDTHNEYEYHLYHYGEHWSQLERWVGVDLTKAKDILAEQKNHSEDHHHAH